MRFSLDELLKVLNLLLVPGIVLLWRLAVRSTETRFHIKALEEHVRAICGRLKIDCTLPKG